MQGEADRSGGPGLVSSLASEAPIVSALVPVFNGERFLEGALTSALGQTMDSLEIIVVNDGSTDRSGELARSYAARHPRRVVYLEQPNAGLPSARNAAIRVAQGRYLALLDCDDVWLPHHLATVVPALENDRSAALVHANVTVVAHDGTPLYTPGIRWANVRDGDSFKAIFLRSEHVSCPTAVFRREPALELGGFDTAFSYLGCEDRDLWLSISARHRIRYVPVVTAHYRLHPDGMSRNLERMRKARLLLVEKHSRHSAGRVLEREALAAVDVETGSMLHEQGDRIAAARYFSVALLRSPLNLRYWRAFAGCIRPPASRFKGRR